MAISPSVNGYLSGSSFLCQGSSIGLEAGPSGPSPESLSAVGSSSCSETMQAMPCAVGGSCPFPGRSCLKCRNGVYDSSPSLTTSSRNSDVSSGCHVRLRNSRTGETLCFPSDPASKSRYRFGQRCAALERAADELGLFVYFLTLTLADDEIGTVNRGLDRFLSAVKGRFDRRGLPFLHVWVAELQKRRYLKSGKKALHWHLAIAAPFLSLPDVAFHPHRKRNKYEVRSDGLVVPQADLLRLWGHGQTFCQYAMSQVGGYLSKYFSKEYERLSGWSPSWGNLRRFGSSQFGRRAYPAWAREGLASLRSEGAPVDDLWVRKIGGRVEVSGRIFHPEWSGRWEHVKGGSRILEHEPVLVDVIRSPWRYDGVFIGDSSREGGDTGGDENVSCSVCG